MDRDFNRVIKSENNAQYDKRCSLRTDNPKKILVHRVPYLMTATRLGKVEIVKNRSIWIENGTIQDVCGDVEAESYISKADLIYDASLEGGVVVTPGFINTHAHSHMYLMRSTLLLEEGEDIDQTIAAMPRWQQFETDESMCIAAIGDFTEQQKYGITTTAILARKTRLHSLNSRYKQNEMFTLSPRSAFIISIKPLMKRFAKLNALWNSTTYSLPFTLLKASSCEMHV